MYVDINSVSYNAKKNQVIIEGIDLDTILLHWDQDQEFDKTNVTFLFDVSENAKGPKLYLYKILKTHVKEEYKTMGEMLMALNGKMISISDNFIVKNKG